MTNDIDFLVQEHTNVYTLDLNALLAWCRDHGIIVELNSHVRADSTPGEYVCQLRRWKPGRRARTTLGWGYGREPHNAIGQAIAHAFFHDRLCPRCFGYGKWPDNGGDCIQCHGTGLVIEGGDAH